MRADLGANVEPVVAGRGALGEDQGMLEDVVGLGALSEGDVRHEAPEGVGGRRAIRIGRLGE